MKDDGKEWHSLPWLCGGVTRAWLTRAAAAYAQVSNNTSKGRTELNPTTFAGAICNFMTRHIYPLDLHSAQIARLMLMNGTHIFGSRFANPGAS